MELLRKLHRVGMQHLGNMLYSCAAEGSMHNRDGDCHCDKAKASHFRWDEDSVDCLSNCQLRLFRNRRE